jgi:hypothetical protein
LAGFFISAEAAIRLAIKIRKADACRAERNTRNLSSLSELYLSTWPLRYAEKTGTLTLSGSPMASLLP